MNWPPWKSPSLRTNLNRLAANKASNSWGNIDLRCSGTTQASRYLAVDTNHVTRLTWLAAS